MAISYPTHVVRSISFVASLSLLVLSPTVQAKEPATLKLEIEQITSGSKHHFFGYIGQCRTIPWNASGRYILCMEIDRIDRMPRPEDAAVIMLVDTHDDNKLIPIDKTHAWNPQQGTMFYWNPRQPETQFFFIDHDVKTGEVFTVLYDIAKKKRVHEYRYRDVHIGNGGVAFDGSFFLGLNYGRLARLRLVTGYPEAQDWSQDEKAPKNDGMFIVDLETGKQRLLVSYRQLEDKLKEQQANLNHSGLFINHTLVNRDADRVYFFVRAGWDGNKEDKINMPCSIHIDGTGLTLHKKHIGGHPEWAEGNVLIGSAGKKQILYDVDTQKIIGELGNSKMSPQPGGDVSLSPDGKWFVNGYKLKKAARKQPGRTSLLSIGGVTVLSFAAKESTRVHTAGISESIRHHAGTEPTTPFWYRELPRTRRARCTSSMLAFASEWRLGPSTLGDAANPQTEFMRLSNA